MDFRPQFGHPIAIALLAAFLVSTNSTPARAAGTGDYVAPFQSLVNAFENVFSELIALVEPHHTVVTISPATTSKWHASGTTASAAVFNSVVATTEPAASPTVFQIDTAPKTSTPAPRTIVTTSSISPASVANLAGIVFGTSTTDGVVTQSELETAINQASNALRQLIYANAGTVGQGQYSSGGYTNNLAISQRIDTLSNVTIANPTVTGTVSGLTAASIPALSSLNGLLGISQGGTGTSTVPAANRLLLSDANGNWEYFSTSTLGIVSGVSTVSNADGTLTISPTSGNVVASLNLANANSWSGQQNFGNLFAVNGSTTNATTTRLAIPSIASALLKTNASGSVVPAIAGTDYENPLTFSAPLSRSVNAISITQSGLSSNGYLSSTDFNTFNNKISSTSLSAAAPLAYNASTGAFSITQAGAGSNGYLASSDWTTFNGKLGSSTIASLSPNYDTMWNGSAFVNGAIYDSGTSIGIGTTSATALLTVDSTSTTGSTLRLSNSDVGGHIYDLISTGSANTSGAGRLDFFDKTAGLARLSIAANGNVGVGTTSPFAIFSVSGNGYFSGTLIAAVQDKGGQVFNAAAYGASPSASATANFAAIQAALTQANTNGGGTVVVSTPGTYAISSTLIIYSNTEFDLGPGVVIQAESTAARGSGALPVLENNAYANPTTYTISSATASGLTVTVTTVTAHSFQVGGSVAIYGIATAGYDGIHTITSVADSTHFTYDADVFPAATPAVASAITGFTTPTAAVVDTNVTIRGGSFDYNYINNNSPSTTLHDMGVILAFIDTLHVYDSKSINSAKYNWFISSVRNGLMSGDSARGPSDGLHFGGNLTSFAVTGGKYGSTGDNSIAAGTADYSGYMITPGPIDGLYIHDLYIDGGLGTRFFGATEFPISHLQIGNLVGNDTGDFPAVQIFNDLSVVGSGTTINDATIYGIEVQYVGVATQVSLSGAVVVNSLTIRDVSIKNLLPQSGQGRLVQLVSVRGEIEFYESFVIQ